MQNHWPVFVAAVLISVAVALGLFRRDQIIEAASHRNPAPVPVTAVSPVAVTPAAAPKLPAEAPDAKVAVAPAAPIAPATPAAPEVAAPAPAAPAAPVAPAAQPAAVPAQPAPPKPPAQKFVMPTTPPPAAPAAPAQPKAPAAPAPAAAPVPVSTGAQTLFNLRGKIEEAVQRKSSDLATGGYAFQLDGARLEVQPMPNWSVTIYNLNPQQQEIETDNFKKLLGVTATELGFDAAQKGTTLSSGKLSLQAATKLGNATIVRDPQNGNSVVITPNQRRIVQPAKPADATPAPGAPATPATPVAPAAQPAPAAPKAEGAPKTEGNTGPATAPTKQF